MHVFWHYSRFWTEPKTTATILNIPIRLDDDNSGYKSKIVYRIGKYQTGYLNGVLSNGIWLRICVYALKAYLYIYTKLQAENNI